MKKHESPQIDSALNAIKSSWEAALQAGCDAANAGDHNTAISYFSQAITQSTRFHPLFHFLESGLNTELGILYHKQNNADAAKSHFERAIWLDHDNKTAKQGIEATSEANFAPYGIPQKIQDMPKGDIWELRQAASQNSDIALYVKAIELCEATHAAYHAAAALPWLHRARSHLAIGERILAKNDGKRGLDLDPTHPDLTGLAHLNVDVA